MLRLFPSAPVFMLTRKNSSKFWSFFPVDNFHNGTGPNQQTLLRRTVNCHCVSLFKHSVCTVLRSCISQLDLRCANVSQLLALLAGLSGLTTSAATSCGSNVLALTTSPARPPLLNIQHLTHISCMCVVQKPSIPIHRSWEL